MSSVVQRPEAIRQKATICAIELLPSSPSLTAQRSEGGVTSLDRPLPPWAVAVHALCGAAQPRKFQGKLRGVIPTNWQPTENWPGQIYDCDTFLEADGVTVRLVVTRHDNMVQVVSLRELSSLRRTLSSSEEEGALAVGAQHHQPLPHLPVIRSYAVERPNGITTLWDGHTALVATGQRDRDKEFVQIELRRKVFTQGAIQRDTAFTLKSHRWFGAQVTSLVTHTDGVHVLASACKEIVFIAVKDQCVTRTIALPSSIGASLSLSPNGRFVVVGCSPAKRFHIVDVHERRFGGEGEDNSSSCIIHTAKNKKEFPSALLSLFWVEKDVIVQSESSANFQCLRNVVLPSSSAGAAPPTTTATTEARGGKGGGAAASSAAAWEKAPIPNTDPSIVKPNDDMDLSRHILNCWTAVRLPQYAGGFLISPSFEGRYLYVME